MRLTTFALFALSAKLLFGSAIAASNAADVAMCRGEAFAGYRTAWRMEPSLRAMIDTHRARMAALCASTAAGATSVTACVAEAAAGPRHVQRGRNTDRSHVERQKALCRKLVRN